MSAMTNLHGVKNVAVDNYPDAPAGPAFCTVKAHDGEGNVVNLFFRSTDAAGKWFRDGLHALSVAEAKPVR